MAPGNLMTFMTPNKSTSSRKVEAKTAARTDKLNHISTKKKPYRHRKSIFSHNSQQLKQFMLQSSNELFNPGHCKFDDQTITDGKVYEQDFCGCEEQIFPCQLIIDSFIRTQQIMEDMRRSYNQLFDLKADSSVNSTHICNLIRILPRNYPQFFITNLNNLLRLLSGASVSQFQCLICILFHAKYECLTYFLYQDMMCSFNFLRQFESQLNNQLSEQGNTSIEAFIAYYHEKGHGRQSFARFIIDYYQSAGANFIPIVHFAKWIVILFEQGHRMAHSLLAKILIEEGQVFSQAMKHLSEGESQAYRSKVMEIKWQKHLGQPSC